MADKLYLRKITLKECGLDFATLDKLIETNPAVQPVLKVYGTVKSLKEESGNLGAYAKFSGGFEAENVKTGQKYRAQNLILPEVAENLLRGIVETGDEVSGSTFALIVSIAPNQSDKGGRKYKYTVNSGMKTTQKDALDLLAESLDDLPLVEDKTPKTPKGKK